MSEATHLRVLVTGANGWIGHALCTELLQRSHAVTALVRQSGKVEANAEEWLHTQADFIGLDRKRMAKGAFDVTIHTAARAHIMDENAADKLSVYRSANTDATLRLADACKQCGIPRFVFVSSIKALGEIEPGRPWRESDVPLSADSLDPYGRSKHEAEAGLRKLADSTFQPIIVRPPLVYGPGVRANFLKLIQAVDRGWPLPLGCAAAPRSLVALPNLVDALIACAVHPRPITPAPVFHVADAQALSVRDLILKIGRRLGKKPLLLPIPVSALRLAGKLSGRSAQIDRLTSPLRMETQAIQAALNWVPRHTTDAALEQTIAWYRSTQSGAS